ncbi:uncharacterized protein CCR75_007819 [Bremia lactucae]|uniref:Uncharacterized protein n=1 Tax=Bremia lactucae TaxID=4779 RepID=A0A976IMB1_BRELC|nr:hypothetical protein CCR75_007819 [Bremia lactucae]
MILHWAKLQRRFETSQVTGPSCNGYKVVSKAFCNYAFNERGKGCPSNSLEIGAHNVISISKFPSNRMIAFRRRIHCRRLRQNCFATFLVLMLNL